ncbi:hypothetical protein D3OALGB2SA_1061 [Olavius algarvensis associated proteobacterium Delta 3]|nr:hypothetical protein D3OALGB2SA_1061 [Olavius algarvensis associated proteobacterium Delta 3]
MSQDTVTFFDPYPFRPGQKIHIVTGPRRGDWEVIGVTDRNVTLRCPISSREFEWKRFCYVVDERDQVEWPQKE